MGGAERASDPRRSRIPAFLLQTSCLGGRPSRSVSPFLVYPANTPFSAGVAGLRLDPATSIPRRGIGLTWLVIGPDRAGNLLEAPASVESVRLDPELRDQLLERAKAEGTTTSEVIRKALRRFLKAT
jgi:hypothetical protein